MLARGTGKFFVGGNWKCNGKPLCALSIDHKWAIAQGPGCIGGLRDLQCSSPCFPGREPRLLYTTPHVCQLQQAVK